VGRWGGEEFLAVLASTDLRGAVAVGERVRSAIAEEPVTVAGRTARVTVSVGCSTGSGEAPGLVLEAGRALRQAKEAGRNRLVAAEASADESPPEDDAPS
jgi:diguanylate cyclase (GGDEF)-like protein